MTDTQTLHRKTANSPILCPERVVQFGAGNFLRAFVDWSIQALNEKADFNSSVVVVRVTPQGRYDALDNQEGLFHVHSEGIQAGALVSETKLITCISRSVYPYEDYEAYLALARQPEIRFLISNTTEAGIRYDESDNSTDTPPTSFPAKLTVFLYERYRHFEGAADKGCIILPTELVTENGTQLREMILRYAQQWGLDANFADWINQHNIFCNTLVDRIVPGYPKDKSADIIQKIGYDDKLLVMAEAYMSWIIEAPDSLQADFPVNQTDLNIKIVPDAAPYQQTKVRILNGLHSSMVPIGYLLGLETVRECIDHDVLGRFLQDEVEQEIIPSMDLLESELQQFAEATLDRFRNPALHHRLVSIMVNSSAKMNTRIVPTIIAFYEKHGQLPQRAVLAVAAFIRLYQGNWQGQAVPLSDDEAIMQWFAEQWQSCETVEDVVEAVLNNQSLWSDDLAQIEGLTSLLSAYLEAIDSGELLDLLNHLNAGT